MFFGYGRSKEKTELKEQKIQLSEAGCERIFIDDCSSKIIRTKFDKMLEEVRSGDTIVVSSIYVFPCTLIELVEILSELHLHEVRFKSLREKINDLTIFQLLNSFQKRSRSERAMANLNDGRKGNKNAGRPPGISEEARKESLAVAELYKQNYTIDEIMNELNMTSRSQVYKRLGEAGISPKRRKKVR